MSVWWVLVSFSLRSSYTRYTVRCPVDPNIAQANISWHWHIDSVIEWTGVVFSRRENLASFAITLSQVESNVIALLGILGYMRSITELSTEMENKSTGAKKKRDEVMIETKFGFSFCCRHEHTTKAIVPVYIYRFFYFFDSLELMGYAIRQASSAWVTSNHLRASYFFSSSTRNWERFSENSTTCTGISSCCAFFNNTIFFIICCSASWWE